MTVESLIEDKSIFRTIIVLMSEIKGVEHAFCVVDDLIFDSTQAFALTLSKKSLDWICGKGGCAHIHFVMRFQTNFERKETLVREMILHKTNKS